MSAPTPAPNDHTPSEPAEEQPFDPHAFPGDLVDAQRELAEAYAALHVLQKRLPWSREPHDGWPAEEEERGRKHRGRPQSPGWAPDDAKAFDGLMAQLRDLTAFVQTHGHWKDCQTHGADLVAARQALKQAPGAVPAPGDASGPIGQDDVRTAA
ncbi:hypothetical protein HCJ76_44025 [Streptomyces sp. MC1]|uniref:hypothetical protein n=1 Tax=Streptomyces sp. MC1 TaxID=295105 RepID=UPI0018CA47E2|nr:hypothetical protein [Streptomyces sp. MC1]MBG7704852.1 hypothetical protein [Streptomyces sp. MC1]